ncbi:threonine--tRNA ligase [Isoptericola sp. NEAU-Y5]|uniref:Threonine--tRNA ligase n=1 Tax=Isoptericola luteus TaxID=2879484 RepID=A0ABS7ZI14_9MICO|nr:threonine--tRNA ligase [Isoptericola sp. NEAU-Y5]MCA5893450.1 threonine--tRNA ligase [Isoptericola sp. NEAU-Y5]
MNSRPAPHAQGPAPVDHRDLGRDMGIFATSPLVGPGLPLWQPAGAVVRRELERLAEDVALAGGSEPVYTPVLGKRSLFERSGHWDKFADDMFEPFDDGTDDPLVLRPANCPHHAQVYASAPRSHRDLPVRYHELGAMFRAERSGVLSGLSRVRQINLDDTHVFCRPDQVAAEVRLALDAVAEVVRVLGIEVDHVRLSRRDDSGRWLGEPARWDDAEGQLGDALAGAGLAWVDGPGEAAFYGPKLDVQVRDARGQVESVATVQIDFNQPERFGLEYVVPDGSRARPVMIHRGTVGSMERMTAFLLEQHGGRLPFWLAPVQVCVLPVGDVAAEDAARALRRQGVRVRVEADGSLGNRVRLARGRRDALLAVLGPREAAAGVLAVSDPSTGERADLPPDELARRAAAAASHRARAVSLRDVDPAADRS